MRNLQISFNFQQTAQMHSMLLKIFSHRTYEHISAKICTYSMDNKSKYKEEKKKEKCNTISCLITMHENIFLYNTNQKKGIQQ